MKKLFSLLTAFLLSAAFSQAADPTLVGTEWQLAQVGGITIGIMDYPPYILLAEGGGAVEGHGSCNSFKGTYELNGDELKFGPIAATKIFCPAELKNRIEKALINALGETRKYAIVDGVLHLQDGQGETLATFKWVAETE
jgi:heat shock protein HslJ